MAKDSRVNRSNKAANVKAKNKSGRANRRAKISTMEEASGFQRSGRDTGSSKSEVDEIPPSAKKSSSSNQQTTVTTPSALGTRRSGRLKKRAPETELEERNPKRAVASVRSSSATRRSERVKMMSSSSPVESMKLEASAGSVRVKKKERSVNELTKETREDDKGNERGVEQVRRKIKTMNARDYKALLKRKGRKKLVVQDQGQVLSVSAKLSKEDNNPCTTSGCDQVDQGSECNKREEGGADCSEEKEKGLKAQCEGVVDNSSPTSTEVTMRECGHMELPPEIPEYMKDAYETAAKGETHDTRSSHNSAEDVCFGSANCGQNLADSFCQTRKDMEVRRKDRQLNLTKKNSVKCSSNEPAQVISKDLSQASNKNHNGKTKRKHHIMWSLSEVMKLVEGVSKYGIGRWTEIKKLMFPSSYRRTSVDIKDKWRNLLKASGIKLQSKGKVHHGQKKVSHQVPESVLCRVRELAGMQPSPKGQKSKVSASY